MSVDLSIVIVSYNTREDLARCLQSLRSAPPTAPSEVIVVDNASRDGSAALVRMQFPEVRLVESRVNVGFAQATNLGIRAGTGTWLLLLNSDTRVPAGAIDTLIATLARRPDVGIVGPRLVDELGRAELSFGRMLSPLNELRQKLLGACCRHGFSPAVAYVERRSREAHEVDWVSGACLLVRRRDAEAVGLLDERYFLYGEDVDFCAAVRQLGRRVLFTPTAAVVHVRGRSVAADPRASALAYRRSQMAFYTKHHPRWAPLLRAYLALKRELP